MLSIRNDKAISVVCGQRASSPGLLDGGQDSASSLGRHDVEVWSRVWRLLELVVERTGEGRVVEDLSRLVGGFSVGADL